MNSSCQLLTRVLQISLEVSTVGSCFVTVHFMTNDIYEPCPVGPSTPDLWCITVTTRTSFLYLARF